MAVRSLNKVMLIGNLTRDPNLRYTPGNTAVCSFGIATNRSWNTEDGQLEERTDFHNIVAWAKLAEICDQILNKGDKTYVEGRLQTREWKSDDGADRRVTEVVIDSMIKLASPRGRDNRNGENRAPAEPADDVLAKPAKPAKPKKAKKEVKKVEAEDVADDIPF
jgi:single-strand DNA-binding protein